MQGIEFVKMKFPRVKNKFYIEQVTNLFKIIQ